MAGNDIPIHLKIILHIIGIASLWVVVTYHGVLDGLISPYIETTKWYFFIPVKFAIAYIILHYVMPRVGVWIYQQLSGGE